MIKHKIILSKDLTKFSWTLKFINMRSIPVYFKLLCRKLLHVHANKLNYKCIFDKLKELEELTILIKLWAYLYSIKRTASHAEYWGKSMSKPITVVKGKQKKPRFCFALVYSFSHLLHVEWSVSIWPIMASKWGWRLNRL